jgi:hypothetical protein
MSFWLACRPEVADLIDLVLLTRESVTMADVDLPRQDRNASQPRQLDGLADRGGHLFVVDPSLGGSCPISSWRKSGRRATTSQGQSRIVGG